MGALRAALLAACLAVAVAALALGAVSDVRERRFPNRLAALLAAACAAASFFWRGPWHLAGGAAAAVCISLLLASAESVLRRSGRTAVGMGDVKALFALMLLDPAPALAAFALALGMLAAWGLARGERTLPLLPFLAASSCVVLAGYIIQL